LFRYVHQCPACGGTIRPAQIGFREASSFPCPNCGALVAVYTPRRSAIFIASILSAATFSYLCGQRGLALILTAFLGSPLLLVFMGFLVGLIATPKLVRASPNQPVMHVRDGDVSLHLTDEPPR